MLIKYIFLGSRDNQLLQLYFSNLLLREKSTKKKSFKFIKRFKTNYFSDVGPARLKVGLSLDVKAIHDHVLRDILPLQ